MRMCVCAASVRVFVCDCAGLCALFLTYVRLVGVLAPVLHLVYQTLDVIREPPLLSWNSLRPLPSAVSLLFPHKMHHAEPGMRRMPGSAWCRMGAANGVWKWTQRVPGQKRRLNNHIKGGVHHKERAASSCSCDDLQASDHDVDLSW